MESGYEVIKTTSVIGTKRTSTNRLYSKNIVIL